MTTIGIDGVNIAMGGGRTHLSELLNSTNFEKFSDISIVIWGPQSLLSVIEDHPKIHKIHTVHQSPIKRLYWHVFGVSKALRAHECDLLFVPGSVNLSRFKPSVVLSQNLLPFQLKEALRFGFSRQTIKMFALTVAHTVSFKLSDGVIFLSKHAQATIKKFTGDLSAKSTVIAHGIDKRFSHIDRSNLICAGSPINLLYVSTIDHYKHQDKILKYVHMLRTKTGLDFRIQFIGSARPSALRKLQVTASQLGDCSDWMLYSGEVNFKDINKNYQNADIGVFASTCENLPNILIEKMASGLPIITTSCEPMPEVLQDAGLYFDINSYDEFTCAVMKMVEDVEVRDKFSKRATSLAQLYDWKLCSDQTFNFLLQIIQKSEI